MTGRMEEERERERERERVCVRFLALPFHLKVIFSFLSVV